MSGRTTFWAALVLTAAVLPAVAGTPLGEGSTYQGQLKDAGLPVNRQVDMQFTLWDAESGGSVMSATLFFDGTNIWVSNWYSNDVTKLRASDGTNLGTFVVGTGPRGLAFDGANIWVPNNGDATVTNLRASDGTNLGTLPVGAGPLFVAFDGANMWVANYGADNVTRISLAR